MERESSNFGARTEAPEKPKLEKSKIDIAETKVRPLDTFESTERPVPESEYDRSKWFEARTPESDRETNPWNLRSSTSHDSVTTPVSGPSFLGLADESRPSVSYLLEDEESHAGRRLVLAILLLLFIGAGAFAALHWKQTVSFLSPLLTKGQSSANSSSGPDLSTSGSEVSPGASQNERTTKMEQNQDRIAMRSSNGQPQPSPAGDGKTAANTPPPVQNAQTVQNDDSAVPSADTKQETSKAPTTSTTATAASAPAATDASKEPAAPSASKATTTGPKHPSDDSTQTVAKASLRQPAPAAPDAQSIKQNEKQDPLFVQGQRYLYGTGVRQNCDLAQKSLMTAAENSNTQAQSTLATMYATGHCVPRSLPLAYRWFAKASHQDPSNPRIEQDLEILWKQMTPEEKQIAIKSR